MNDLKAKQARLLLDRYQHGNLNFRQFTHLLASVMRGDKQRKESFSTDIKQNLAMIQSSNPVVIADIVNSSDLEIIAKDVDKYGFIVKVRAIGSPEEVELIGGGDK
jgi:CHASE3 domain sensor protein